MDNIIAIGIDLAKSVLQLHGAGAEGKVPLLRQPQRSPMLAAFQRPPAVSEAHNPGRAN